MGTVVISIDAELGWGFHDYPAEQRPTERIARSRQGWKDLAETLDEYDIPATWAVVGHLFEHDCAGAHVGHPSPSGWFAHERGDEPMDEQFRFAPDLIADLVESDVDHDIGAHTYSHVEFDADYATDLLARAECDRATEAAEAAGVTMRSFVFPRNRVGHREILAESGFTCYRGTEPETTADGPYSAPLRKLAQATVVRDPPPLVEPSVDEYGLVNIPASLYLFGFEGPARRVLAATVGDPVVKQARLGIDAAAAEDGICHLWLHPNNLTTEADLDRVRAICAYVDRVRADTDLTVETMRSVADRVRAEDLSVA
ncbi:polysaccharide deacetylase family protein [Haloarcula onubensis]|uniref:Polysaccharide deacetylase family protein n=1 Tax=Haloarcula onubensis TaxID=2950539 RepID=A0ABU2FLY3_9EURY|nr:polysaccharide deacetylase family protein [Halomicroarcula sp. S3CR25-11]MDS0281776.1 polysaccharide deacetylase family protein [Halomicroarcula sp. S3CR25-11]